MKPAHLAITCLFLVLLTFANAGCSRRSSVALDASLARASLQTFLTTWQSGKDVTTLKTGESTIIASDDDQVAGARLKSFKVLDEGTSDGRNLHIKTSLTTRSQRGRVRTIVTTYVVGTHPLVTIFRE